MWYLLTGFLCIFLVLISGEAAQKNRRAKATQKAIVEEFLQCAQKIKKSTMIETNWPDRWTTFASNERLRRLSSVRDVPKDDAGVFWLENIEHWSQEADLYVRANVPRHTLFFRFGWCRRPHVAPLILLPIKDDRSNALKSVKALVDGWRGDIRSDIRHKRQKSEDIFGWW